MKIEDLETLVKGRRSIRQWKTKEVPDELLKKAVELATWSPNGGNFQGWYFMAIKKKEVIDKLADAVQRVADKVGGWPEADGWREEITRYQKTTAKFRNAPALIALFASEYQSPLDKILMMRESFDPESKRILACRRSAPTAIQTAAAAATTMLLAFHQMGLGAVWLVSPLQAKEEIEKILEKPAGLFLTCLIAVGYPDESPTKDRKPVDEVLKFIK